MFEVGRLVRQSNEIVEHLRELLFNIEQDFLEFKERFGDLLGDVAGISKGVKAISAWISNYTGGVKLKKTKTTVKKTTAKTATKKTTTAKKKAPVKKEK